MRITASLVDRKDFHKSIEIDKLSPMICIFDPKTDKCEFFMEKYKIIVDKNGKERIVALYRERP